MKPKSSPHDASSVYDPVYLHSLRELWVIVGLFVAFCAWSVATCYLMGYVDAGEEHVPALYFGMPAWVFWGILVPWLAVDIVAVWFCFFFMKNDDLDAAHEGQDLREQIRHEHQEESGDE